jgi:hypothetical protein
MPGQRRSHGVDDIAQEIGLIGRIAIGASENHPIGPPAAITSTSTIRRWVN